MDTTAQIRSPRTPGGPTDPRHGARAPASERLTSGEMLAEILPLPVRTRGRDDRRVNGPGRAGCRYPIAASGRMSARVSLRLPAAPGVVAPVKRSGEVSEADAALFQTTRPRLFGIAYRILGGASEADDVVQETWIRWQGTDRSQVRDATAFLATTTTRLAINVTQSARARRETHIGPRLADAVDGAANPSLDAEQSEALESAVRMLVQKLSPAERAAYVLREAFDYPYRRISQVLALSEANARQLVTRARRHLGGEHRRPVGATEHQRLLDAFVAAAQTGDLATLEQVLAAGAVVPATRLPMRRGPVVRVAA
jgi:RNA polymerase sigma factor (sigma-70 family)